MAKWTQQGIAQLCDYELGQAIFSEKDIIRACKDAKQFGAAAVCVNGLFVRLAAEELKDSDVKVSGYVSFPLGGCTIESKKAETIFLEQEGADEVDLVLAVGYLRSKNYEYIKNELRSICEAVSIPVKVIIECPYLDDDLKIKACEIAKEAGITFIASNTGCMTAGATISDISLIRKTMGDQAHVKACGGVMTIDDVMAMVEAGADRVGIERFTEIMHEAGALFS